MQKTKLRKIQKVAILPRMLKIRKNHPENVKKWAKVAMMTKKSKSKNSENFRKDGFYKPATRKKVVIEPLKQKRESTEPDEDDKIVVDLSQMKQGDENLQSGRAVIHELTTHQLNQTQMSKSEQAGPRQLQGQQQLSKFFGSMMPKQTEQQR